MEKYLDTLQKITKFPKSLTFQFNPVSPFVVFLKACIYQNTFFHFFFSTSAELLHLLSCIVYYYLVLLLSLFISKAIVLTTASDIGQ